MNELFPVFLRVDRLHTLVVGGGNVAAEKLHFLLKSSPSANVTVVTDRISDEVRSLTDEFQVPVIKRRFADRDLIGKQVAIVAIGDRTESGRIKAQAERANVLCNVADDPVYCDFYLGGVVTKGELKIAISTNGKSPTMAKRIRQLLEEVLPDELDTSISYLNNYRNSLTKDLAARVTKLNAATVGLLNQRS